MFTFASKLVALLIVDSTRRRWRPLAIVAALVIGILHPTSSLTAQVGDPPQTAPARERGLEVAVLLDASSRTGDIGAHAIRGVLTNLYAALDPGDRVTVFAATRYAPTEVLVIVRRDTDAAAAIIARAWREKAEPLSGRTADIAGGVSKFLEARGKAPLDLLLILPSTRLGAEGASAIWAGAKTARDGGALVWSTGPDDPDLRSAAATGVLAWLPIDRADPAAWVADARQRRGGDGTSAELQRVNENLKSTNRSLELRLQQRDADVTNRERKIATRDESIEGLKRDLGAANEGRRAAEAGEVASRADAEAHHRAVAESQSRIEVAEAKAHSLEGQLDQANVARASTEQALTDLHADYERRQAAWERQFESSTAETGELRTANATLQTDNDHLRIAIQDAARTEAPPAAPEAAQGDIEPTALGIRTDASQSGNGTAERTGRSVYTRRQFLLPVGAVALVLVGIGGWRLAHGRHRVLRVKGTWVSRSGASAPFDVTFDPACQVLSLPREAEPFPCGLEHVEDQPHLGARGGGLEVRAVRADCDVTRNGEPIADTHALVAIGDEVAVRHADGATAHVVIRSVQRLVPPRHLKPTTEAVASAVTSV